MSRYVAQKRKVSFTGMVSLWWHLGRGYVNNRLTAKDDRWCVYDQAKNKNIAICSSEANAVMIANQLNCISDE